MTDYEINQLVQMIQGEMLAASIVSLVLAVLGIIALWKVFDKAGEKGWKALIPFYNIYILYKISWSPMMFWWQLAAEIVGGCIAFFGNLYGNQMMIIVGVVLSLVGAIINYVQTWNLSLAFGHGIGYFLGLIFLPTIFYLILAFGGSRYLGAREPQRSI